MVGGSDCLRSGLIAAELVPRAASLTKVENVKPLCIKGFTRLTNGGLETVVQSKNRSLRQRHAPSSRGTYVYIDKHSYKLNLAKTRIAVRRLIELYIYLYLYICVDTSVYSVYIRKVKND